jgi:hypothetical protein
MKKTTSIYIAQRIMLRGHYAEEGETHVVTEAELDELQAAYPGAIVPNKAGPDEFQDVSEPAFNPAAGKTLLQEPAPALTNAGDAGSVGDEARGENGDDADDVAEEGAEDGDDNQPGGNGRKGNTRRAGAKRPA